MGSIGIFDFLHRRIDTAEVIADLEAKVQKVAAKEAALFVATSYICNALACCEIKTYEKGEPVKNELYYRLNVSPNPNESAAEFRNHALYNYFYRGEALVVPLRNNLYVADSFGIEEHPLGNDVYENVVVGKETLRRRFRASSAFMFRPGRSNGAKDVIDGLARDYEDLMAAIAERAKADNGEKYILDLENMKAGDPRFAEEYGKVVKNQLLPFINNPKAVYPQFKGYKLERMAPQGTGSADGYMQLRKDMFDVVGQAFHIPQSLMLGNMNSAAEIFNQFLTSAVDPIAKLWSDELTRKTTDYETWSRGDRVKIDTSCVRHVDLFEVAAAADKLISSGVASIDEARRPLGLDELGEDFATRHWITKNYIGIEDAGGDLAAVEGGDNDE